MLIPYRSNRVNSDARQRPSTALRTRAAVLLAGVRDAIRRMPLPRTSQGMIAHLSSNGKMLLLVWSTLLQGWTLMVDPSEDRL